MTGYDLANLPARPVREHLSVAEANDLMGVTVPAIEPTITKPSILTLDGEPVLAYYPLATMDAERLRKAVVGLPTTSTLRVATGFRNRTRVFGMAPRRVSMKRESCRATWMSHQEPERHAVLVSLAAELQDHLKQFAPQAFTADRDTMGQVNEEWRMTDGSLWTSGIVNETSTLPYHRDRLNFDTWSAMPVLRRGVAGGHLHLPEFNETIECRDGFVVTFPGYRYVHGVTPIRTLRSDGYRYSIVYYALRGMKDCFTYAVELGEAHRRRTEREDHAAAVLRGEAQSRL